MGFFDFFPYTNWHNVNLDWVLQRVKEWGELVTANDIAFHNLEEANASFKEYVTNYLQNLDVQDEINIKMDSLLESGVLTEYLQPYVSEDVSAWLDEHITEPTGVVIDTSLTVSGACADAKTVGDRFSALLPGLTNNAKIALLNCFDNVTWKNGNGEGYIDILRNMLDVQPVSENPFEYAEYEVGGYGYNQRGDASSGCASRNDTIITRVRTVTPVWCEQGRLIAKTGYEINLYMLNSLSYGDWATSGGIIIEGYYDLAYVGNAYYQWSTVKEILEGTQYCIVVVRKTSGDEFTQEEAEAIYDTGFVYEREW